MRNCLVFFVLLAVISIFFLHPHQTVAQPSCLPAGDLNCSGIVDLIDLGLVLQYFGSTDPRGDVDKNGTVSLHDITLLLGNFGKLAPTVTITSTPAPPTATITPTTSHDHGAKIDASDTDNVVNAFMLDETRALIEQGKAAAIAGGGAWWGPEEKAHEDQLWIIRRGIQFTNHILQPGKIHQVEITCLLPGSKFPVINQKYAGTARNSLKYPYSAAGIKFEETDSGRVPRLGEWETLTPIAPGVEDSGKAREIGTSCLTNQSLANPFNETPSPTALNDRLLAALHSVSWIGRTGTFSTYHVEAPVKKEYLDFHAWYTDIEYHQIWLLNPEELVGKTVKGEITVRTTVAVRGHTATQVHHHGVKIEINGDDYWALNSSGNPQFLHSLPSQPPIQPRRAEQGTIPVLEWKIDTTKLADGWHIVSPHTHILDKTTTPTRDKQLAAELKFPLCVNNTNRGICP